jgi:hypothetical protein
MRNYKVTINTAPGTSLDISQWNIFPLDGETEPERVSVKVGEKEYSLRIDGENVAIEIWSVDKNGDLNELLIEQVL